MTISSDVQKLTPGSIIDLYELDPTQISPTADKLFFHNGVNELGNTIVWKTQEYVRFPIVTEGFEYSGAGTLPRPRLKVANITGLISLVAKTYGDLVGAKVIRRRTFLKYLDAVNFEGGVNPTADPNVAFPDEVWYIDRKSAENPLLVEFELSAAFDVAGVLLPRRQCIQNLCTFEYRGPECGYAGPSVADPESTYTGQDRCGKKLSSCRLRFDENTVGLPFGGFPGTGRIR